MKRILSSEVVKYKGQEVFLCGWVHARRDHGKIIFVDLRDASGLTQIVFTPANKKVYQQGDDLRPEYVIGVKGIVQKRPSGTENPKLLSGEVEVLARELIVFNKSLTPPFEISQEKKVSESLRLKYRYLDLRKPRVRNNLEKRYRFIKAVREYLDSKGFIEIETPLLTKSTPEGARDFLVPSRFQPGKFYALPQAPQQYKQLLMIAGIEKYFQIAPCFRDEDPRADRSYGEFYQIDIEMSFVKREEIMDLVEDMLKQVIRKVFPEKHFTFENWPRLKYEEVIRKYHSDKPDLRKNKNDPHELAFTWILDFPLFVKQTKEDFFYGAGPKWAPAHNPFTMPQEKDIPLLDKNPGAVKSYQYDLVLNGVEVGGGAIRIHKAELQEKIFDLIGLTKKQKAKFKHFLTALSYGAPPHGGIAPGIERMLMILCNEPNLREVIAFPKTGDGNDLMMEAPSSVSPEQLRELHIKVIKKD